MNGLNLNKLILMMLNLFNAVKGKQGAVYIYLIPVPDLMIQLTSHPDCNGIPIGEWNAFIVLHLSLPVGYQFRIGQFKAFACPALRRLFCLTKHNRKKIHA